MKNKSVIITLLFISIAIGLGIYLYTNNTSNENNNSYEATRTATNNTENENTNTNIENEATNTNNTDKPIEEKNEENNSTPEPESEPESKSENEPKSKPVEIEIASFSSKIRQKRDSDRQNNISLACSTLNGTIVENGKTFSFCNTVGKTSKKKGYEEAKVFQNGKEVEAMGGGLCQVSSTLYNAVLKVSNLKIVERHSHSKEVYYVPKGKDAAVAYGSYDFKFKNNTGNSIKIKASNTANNVTIKLLKIE